MRRKFFFVAGCLCLAVGVPGLYLPLVPGTPLLLLALFCFARSSERLHHYLRYHPRLAPHLDNWEANGSIAPTVKRRAVATMALSGPVSLYFVPYPAAQAAVGAIMVGVACYLLSRPAPVEKSKTPLP